MRAEKVNYCMTCGGKLRLIVKPASTRRAVWTCIKCGDSFRRVTALQKIEGGF